MIWILCKCHFSPINYLYQMSKLHFFLKESKEMYKIVQLISNFLYYKNLPPSMKIHVHWMNLMKNQERQILKF
jgi:hypothetical protein